MSAKATVTLTVEITLGDKWGSDCTVGQAERQARGAAHAALARVLSASTDPRIKLMSVGPVTLTITEAT